MNSRILRCFTVVLIGFLALGSAVHADSGKPMAFLIWGEGEPAYVAPGGNGVFQDGNRIALLHETEGFDFSKDTFVLDVKIGEKSLSHSFKIDNFAGKNAWLVVDPAGTDYTPAFTDAFLAELCRLPAGKHEVKMVFKANGTALNHGSLTCDSNGAHAKFKKILGNFQNVSGSRQAMLDAHEAQEERQRVADDAQRAAANGFKVSIQNDNQGQTVYVIAIDDRTRSEAVHEVLPGKTKTLELHRGQGYTLKAFNQDAGKDSTREIGKVDQSADQTTIRVK
jgi:hypothetical protein